MAVSTGKIGLGAVLKMGDGASPTEAFTAIANIASISGPSETMETVDTTHLSSTGGYREFRPHLKDGGEVTFTIHYDPTHATHDDATGLKKKFDDRLLTNFQIDLSNLSDGGGGFASNNLITFAAYVTNLGMNVPIDDMVTRDVTLKVSGAIAITDAA